MLGQLFRKITQIPGGFCQGKQASANTNAALISSHFSQVKMHAHCVRLPWKRTHRPPQFIFARSIQPITSYLFPLVDVIHMQICIVARSYHLIQLFSTCPNNGEQLVCSAGFFLLLVDGMKSVRDHYFGKSNNYSLQACTRRVYPDSWINNFISTASTSNSIARPSKESPLVGKWHESEKFPFSAPALHLSSTTIECINQKFIRHFECLASQPANNYEQGNNLK